MADYNRSYIDPEKTDSPRRAESGAPRAVVGGVLLAVGVGAMLWVLTVVIGLITSETTPGLVRSITPATEVAINAAAEHRITIDPELFGVVGYGMVCFLCLIASSMAGAMMKGGLALLLPSKTKDGKGDAAEKYYPRR